MKNEMKKYQRKGHVYTYTHLCFRVLPYLWVHPNLSGLRPINLAGAYPTTELIIG